MQKQLLTNGKHSNERMADGVAWFGTRMRKANENARAFPAPPKPKSTRK